MYQLMIVEDEQNIREGLALLFPWKTFGFEVAGTFGAAAQALAYVEEHAVDAVLSDIMLPQMNGLEMAREILLLQPSAQIVFLTGYRDFEFAHEAVRMHACNYLLKPVKHEELVNAFLEIRDRLDQLHSADIGAHPEGYYEKIIAQAQTHILQNLRTVSLESAALSVNLSCGYLSRLFKECTGTGFSEYCMQARMNHAATLLRQTDLRTYEISDRLGYDNPKNFTRAFRKHFGVSPREYRDGGTSQAREDADR